MDAPVVRTWEPGRLRPDVHGRRGLAGMALVLRGYWRPFTAAVALGTINQGMQVAAAVVAAAIAASALGGASSAALWQGMALLAVLVLLRAAATWGEAWVSHELAYRVLAEVRQWLYDAFVRLAPGKLAGRRSGEQVSAAMSDSEAMEMFYAHSLIYAVVAAIVPTGALVALAVVDPRLSMTLVGFVIASVVIPVALRRANARQGRVLRAQLAVSNGEVAEAVGGLGELVAFGRGDDLCERLDRSGRRLDRTQLVQGVRAGVEIGGAHVLTAVGTLAVLWVGAGLVDSGELTAAALVPVTVLAAFTFQPVLTMLGATRIWGVTTSAADRVFDLLETAPTVDDAGEIDEVQTRARVEFAGVTFAYESAPTPAVDSVSFAVDPGETVALVGHSGAGKTTCAHLLARFADPTQGQVRLGQTDIRDLTLDALHRAVAYVPQEVFLLHATVADNIRLAMPDASDDEVEAAAETAQAHEFIAELDDGYETVVGDRGVRLSGGERQRIAIARTVLRGAPVLVMDEGTAMLDAISERELRNALATDAHRRATLLIAHRLSTILAADRIVVLERGRVVDTGTHDALMDRCEPYRRLVADQWSGLVTTTDATGHRQG